MPSSSLAVDEKLQPKHYTTVSSSQAWFGYSIYFDILSQHGALSRHERETLRMLQGSPKRVRKGEVIKSDTCNNGMLLAIQDGWACSCRLTKDGDRQIIDLYLPGDIVGLRDYQQSGRFDEIIMLTEGLIIPAPKNKIDKAMEGNSKLIHAFLGAAMYQSNIMADRLNNLISHDATTRIAYFILELHARLHLSHPEARDIFFPLSQQVIGDLLGMTNVHVCRCLNHLESLELLHRDKEARNIKILNYEELLSLAGFSTAYIYSYLKPSNTIAH